VEAAAAGLPVITHDAPHFRWLLPNPDCWIDMEAPGALAALLARMAADPGERERRLMRDQARASYDWAALRPAYADLYRSMMP
jgi:glycosyltransferase involved in cell wall biosynthesis